MINQIKTINLGQLKTNIPAIGMGTRSFSPKKKKMVFNILDHYIELGGRLIDTAEVYGNPDNHGYSEQVIGMWLEERKNRNGVIIETKGCLPGTCKPLHPEGIEVNPEGIIKAITGSLKRLKTDYIDIWMLHRDDPTFPVEPIIDTLNEEINKGRILSYGVSNWSVKRIQEAIDYARDNNLKEIIASSINFCLVEANKPYWPGVLLTKEEDINWHKKTQIPLFSWSTLGNGFFAYGDPNYKDNEFLVQVLYSDKNFERLNRAKALAKKKGVTTAEIAMAYVVNQDFPVVALVGSENIEQVDSCFKGINIILSDREVKWLNLLGELE